VWGGGGGGGGGGWGGGGGGVVVGWGWGGGGGGWHVMVPSKRGKKTGVQTCEKGFVVLGLP